MKKMSIVLLSLGILFFSLTAYSVSLDKQTYVKIKDFTVENTIGIPDSVGWVAVHGLGVEFPPHNASSTESRSNGRGHRIYDFEQGVWNDTTFEFHGNKDDMKAIFEDFNKFDKGDIMRGSISVNIMNPKDSYKTIATFELQDLTLLRYSSNLVANVEHPETLKFSFTVSPGYVKISTYMDDENNTKDSEPLFYKMSSNHNPFSVIKSLINLKNAFEDFNSLSNQMPLMESISYSGIEMQKNDTTIAGDQYGTDTCHVDNYGVINMEFKMEPNSTEWITRVKDLYEGNIGGAKPNGGLKLTNRSGEVTSSYDILGWHIESFNFPTFDSKSDSQLIQYVTIRIEKVTDK